MRKVALNILKFKFVVSWLCVGASVFYFSHKPSYLSFGVSAVFCVYGLLTGILVRKVEQLNEDV